MVALRGTVSSDGLTVNCSAIAPLHEFGDGDIRLSGHLIQRLAAQQIAILR
jgi:hypothetical protein